MWSVELWSFHIFRDLLCWAVMRPLEVYSISISHSLRTFRNKELILSLSYDTTILQSLLVTLIKINYYNYCTALWLLGAEMWKQMQLRKYGRKIWEILVSTQVIWSCKREVGKLQTRGGIKLVLAGQPMKVSEWHQRQKPLLVCTIPKNTHL